MRPGNSEESSKGAVVTDLIENAALRCKVRVARDCSVHASMCLCFVIVDNNKKYDANYIAAMFLLAPLDAQHFLPPSSTPHVTCPTQDYELSKEFSNSDDLALLAKGVVEACTAPLLENAPQISDETVAQLARLYLSAASGNSLGSATLIKYISRFTSKKPMEKVRWHLIALHR